MHSLSFADIAREIDEPVYAVRAVADRFVLYIPSTRIADERFYPDEALATFRLIFDQLHVGVRDEYVDVLLARRFPVAEVTVAGIHGAGLLSPQLPARAPSRLAAPVEPPRFTEPGPAAAFGHPGASRDDIVQLHEQIGLLSRRIEELGSLVARSGPAHTEPAPAAVTSPSAIHATRPAAARETLSPSPAAPANDVDPDSRLDLGVSSSPSPPPGDDDFTDLINRSTSRLGSNVSPLAPDPNGTGKGDSLTRRRRF